ncbi:MAG: hypothetical protein PHR22_04160 [Candidatus Omnitrophica bacterium]|nr:hypothetical protein [Candidatus Omnitrophota bacterium]
MVASIAVIAIGLAVILRSFTSSLRASKIAQEYFEASLLVQDAVAALEIEEKLAGGVGESDTSEQVTGTRYNLGMKITKINDEDTLNEAIAVISWTNKERNEKIGIGTYLKGQAGIK